MLPPPPNLRDWLPENHLAYFVSDSVENLNLPWIYGAFEEDLRGQPPYEPRMMTRLLVYGYCVGVHSARKIQQKVLEGIFEQMLKLALELGALKAGRVALDGSKVKANASKHNAMSYERMKEQEKAIRKQVKELLAQAEATDSDEERARRQAVAEGKPEDKEQYNFTDPESRIIKSGAEGFAQAYNAQIVVEPALQLIVEQAVTQAANDKEQLPPMMKADLESH